MGQLLAKLGDPRPAVLDVDHMPFAFVPAGAFVMGDPESEKPPREWIFWSPQHTLTLPYGYWIGRFPVTNAHFAPFVAAGGYAEPRYWPEAIAAKLWENGTVNMYTYLGDGKWEQQKRTAPRDYGADFNAPNQPRVGLSWYEAIAYARWLTERWHTAGWLPADWEVTLPSEAEWEKAARGGLEIPTVPHLCPVADGLTPPHLSLQAQRQPAPPLPVGRAGIHNRTRQHRRDGHRPPQCRGSLPAGNQPRGVRRDGRQCV
ncbi:MAG: SUMF1/EgtB/PvdO family nonheme iron enzyme [Chloroflexi bacterium]|nr:SUMF1/EgtB/PvdO family nonheme iron enzyme [Chloroflexota bacterium]